MQVFETFQEITDKYNIVIALGTFDGLHLGHQAVIQHAIDQAKAMGGHTMVITFSDHPYSIVCPERVPLQIVTQQEKCVLLKKMGVDYVLSLKMNRQLIDQSPLDFLTEIMTYISPRAIVVGDNYTFGKKKAGTILTLKTYFERDRHIPVTVLTLLCTNTEMTISSTAIRREIVQGHMELAAKMLGRPYMLQAIVQHGDERGRKISFPTANIMIPDKMAIPPDGVYIVKIEVSNTLYQGVANIGDNPTFTDQYRRLEVHILDFSDNIYQKEIKVFFLKRLRDELKFNKVDDLIAQMCIDVADTRIFFDN